MNFAFKRPQDWVESGSEERETRSLALRTRRPWQRLSCGRGSLRGRWSSLSLSLSLFLNWSDAGHLGGARQGLRTRDMRQGYGRGMASEEWKEWNIKVGFSCWYVHHTFS